MKKRYFVVNLITGKQLAFGKRCNNVDHGESDYIFKDVQDNKKSFICLGIIPRENILSVILIDEEPVSECSAAIKGNEENDK